MKAVNATVRRSLAAAAAVLTVPVLSSCVPNFNAPTDQVYNPGVGVNDRSGSVDVLHALVVSGAPGSGTVIAALVNQDDRNDDALTGVTGAGADQGLRIASTTGVDIPAGELVQLADDGDFSIEGEAIEPGHFVTVTFSFERGDSVTIDVPVVERSGAFADVPVPSVAPTTPEPTEESAAGH